MSLPRFSPPKWSNAGPCTQGFGPFDLFCTGRLTTPDRGRHPIALNGNSCTPCRVFGRTARRSHSRRATRSALHAVVVESDASRSVSRILSPPAVGDGHPSWMPVARHLVRSTRDLGRAAPGRRGVRPCSTLLRAGFTWPAGHPTAGGLLPHHFTVAATAWVVAVSFLWHSPSGRPDWTLSSALLSGVRTFLRRRTARGRPTGLPSQSSAGAGGALQRRWASIPGSGLCEPHRGRPESGRRAAASRTCC